ncbi:APH-domain-containing protein [Aureobasidium subglaciale]|nr:APH-domain-containing protein [Aureobasidium subglaciale]
MFLGKRFRIISKCNHFPKHLENPYDVSGEPYMNNWLDSRDAIVVDMASRLAIRLCNYLLDSFLKRSDGTRLEEVLAMDAARRAGIPVPRIICYGDHADAPHAPISILVTRLPGQDLGEVYKTLSPEEIETILQEMKAYLTSIREWKSPWGQSRICSSSGKAIRSIRVPYHEMGPFDSEQQMNDYLLYPAGPNMWDDMEEFLSLKKRVDRLFSNRHRIVYTHGDLKHHNIMVHNGHVSGFIDWKSAGWYPEYWEFTTALRFTREDFWWYAFVIKLGGDAYLGYRDAERALTQLTGDFTAW